MFRESFHILLIEGVLFFLSIVGWGIIRRMELLIIASLFAGMMISTIFFFRDPKRKVATGNNIIISPADGRIIYIDDIPYFSLSTGSVKVVMIYLSLWDVHINRMPISGQVTYLDHQQGCFYPAFKDCSSKKNEYTIVGITGEMGKIFIKQIAGTFARRIVCRLKMGEQVRQGERFGMIKFGSRIELYLPHSVVLKVGVGDRIRGGESIIAEKI